MKTFKDIQEMEVENFSLNNVTNFNQMFDLVAIVDTYLNNMWDLIMIW